MLLLTFNAGPNQYAIDVTWVVEVVPRVELRSIPHSPAYLSGLLGYRGTIIPVVDLGVLLGLDACGKRLSTRIILLKEPSKLPGRAAEIASEGTSAPRLEPARPVFGLMADQVSQLAYVQPTDLLPAPVQLSEAPYLGGVAKTEHGIVQIVDIIKLKAVIEF